VKKDQSSHSHSFDTRWSSRGTLSLGSSFPKVIGGGRLDSTAFASITRPSKTSSPVTRPFSTMKDVTSALSSTTPPLRRISRDSDPASLWDPP
jgi:hypothetical protein